MESGLKLEAILGVITIIILATIVPTLLSSTTTMQHALDETEQAASYIVWRDGDSYLAKNGTTSRIDFKGTNASDVIQDAANAIGAGNRSGLIYLKPAYGTELTWTRPNDHRWNTLIDFQLTSTIYLPGGVSVVGNGVKLDVSSMNEVAFHIATDHYAGKVDLLHIAGLGFYGDDANTNFTAIYVDEYPNLLTIENNKFWYTDTGIMLEGAVYGAKISHNNFWAGSYFINSSSSSTLQRQNGAIIDGNAVEQATKVGIRIYGDGIHITDSYIEYCKVGLELHGIINVGENFIQPITSGNIGVEIWDRCVISGNYIKAHKGVVGIMIMDGNRTHTISSNYFKAEDSGIGIGSNPSLLSVQAAISGNSAHLEDWSGYFIKGNFTACAITGNDIRGGFPAIDILGDRNTISSNNIRLESYLGFNITGVPIIYENRTANLITANNFNCFYNGENQTSIGVNLVDNYYTAVMGNLFLGFDEMVHETGCANTTVANNAEVPGYY